MNDPSAQWNKPAISQVVHSRSLAYGFSIRTKRWRYTEWNRGAAGVELYDHDNDPDEITNLAKKPEYAPIVAKLIAALKPYVETMNTAPSQKTRKKRKKK